MSRPAGASRAGLSAIVVSVAVLLSACGITRDSAAGEGSGTPTAIPSDVDALRAVAQSKVFFGHQSVGKNILDGIPAVYAAAGATAPRTVEASTPPEGTAIAHAYVGQNGDPQSKIDAFAKGVRSGFGEWADVALMKFCYLDIVKDSDVSAIFGSYKATMSALEREYPQVSFLYLTVPLTTQPGLKDRIKVSLGRGTDHRANNAARERFNALVRAEYAGTGSLVDVAALESTTPSGERVSGTVDGQTYYALYEGFAADPGHLNGVGSQVVAAGLLDVVGRSVAG